MHLRICLKFASKGGAAALTPGNKSSTVRAMKAVKVPALELFLHEMIPLAKAMGVGVEVSDERALVLTAPKEQNKNSLNTAFGGSLVSLATLAGYGVVGIVVVALSVSYPLSVFRVCRPSYRRRRLVGVAPAAAL